MVAREAQSFTNPALIISRKEILGERIMKIEVIEGHLIEAGYNQKSINKYISYLKKLAAETNNRGLKNGWIKNKTEGELVSYFEKVAETGLDFDGEHVTLQSTGISFDYIALKNKLYLIYPESIIDTGIVYKDDTFKFEKKSGSVAYVHEINNPFNQDEDNIIGVYCIIKNKRGEFLTLLDRNQIEKHRKVARTDSVWRSWLHEMILKTIIKKACKIHFADLFQDVETLDNEQQNLENPLGISIGDKAIVEGITDIEELRKFWGENKGRNAGVLKDFNILVANRKAEIEKESNKDVETDDVAVSENKDENKDKTEKDSVREPGEEG